MKRAILPALAFVLAFLFVVPMVYTAVSSLKPREEIFEFPIRWIPKHVSAANFTVPFVRQTFGLYFVNSAVVAAAVTLASLALSSMAGYSLAKFQYRGRNALFLLVLLTMMLPMEITMVPLALVDPLPGTDEHPGGTDPARHGQPAGHLLDAPVPAHFAGDYADAARIDGLGELQIYARIILPLSLPALGALAIFSFMTNWNSLIWPLIVATRNEIRTLPVGLVSMVGEYDTAWNELFAMAVATVIPTLVFFLILRGRLIHGMAMVGIKV